MEKISKDKIPFKETRYFWLNRKGKQKHSSKSTFDSTHHQQSKLLLPALPPVTTPECHNSFRTLDSSLRVQASTHYDYFVFSKVHQVRSKGRTEI
jgi:hypothetical protein